MSLSLRRLVPALASTGMPPAGIAEGRHAQELTYLLDRAGADLGYRYKWDVFGPFSVELAEDLEDLTEEAAAALNVERTDAFDEAAQRVVPLMTPPEDVTEDAWLRLLVCVDFLQTRSRVSVENGDSPPFLRQNFEPHQIQAAKERIESLYNLSAVG